MKKVEAPTLEEAYQKASQVLECSISELQCEVVQHPAKGILGFLKKNAIIIATCTHSPSNLDKQKQEVYIADEIIATVKEEVAKEEVAKEEVVKEEVVKEEKDIAHSRLEKDVIVDKFFNEKESNDELEEDCHEDEVIVYDELALVIENQIKELLSHSCFEIDVVEVDVIDNTALIFIDGNDAALLIGKEGYRYNALSYILFSWLHTKYELFIKLEIAEFLTKQQEMIKSYIKPVIEQVEKNGRGKTRFLDGILVQIALEQLREKLPNKYVAVKTSRDGKKFVVINEFNTKINA